MAAVAKLTVEPARAMGLPLPTLKVGAPATLTVVEIARTRTVTPAMIFSKSRNTPFFGWELSGWPLLTMKAGQVIFHRGDDHARISRT
ncbi:MAG: hypothetical protein KatS3mg115_2109 [Candidatus Poribacteria bacterium]|nr:MAG: hypothetical protein KatS3mg115_2109 [Candidatus Poribacteria bacterium]